MAETGIGMECCRWQAGTILGFLEVSCDEILQVREHWMGSCSPGQSSMAAVHGGLCQFYANVE